MSIRTAGTWAGIVVITGLTGCASTGSSTGMAANRPVSTIPTRANPNPTATAGNTTGGATNASAWNTMGANGRTAAPNFNPTGNSPTTNVPPNNGIQPVSGIAPQMPNSGTITTPSTSPIGGTPPSSPPPGSSSMKNSNSPADAAWKSDVKLTAANAPKPAEVTRSSMAAPQIDEAANTPPLPAPATLELTTPTPQAANGLTVQPVLMNASPPAQPPTPSGN